MKKKLRAVWCRNESVRAEIGQILQTHAAKLVVEILYIYIYRVYADSHSLGQLALASKRTASTLKGSFTIAQYPVRWTGQSALHFLPSLADLFIPTPTPGSILAMLQLRAKTKSLTFPPLSRARYSFIQLSEQGRQWRERKCPIFETVTKGDSNPGSLDWESGILPLSYRAPWFSAT